MTVEILFKLNPKDFYMVGVHFIVESNFVELHLLKFHFLTPTITITKIEAQIQIVRNI